MLEIIIRSGPLSRKSKRTWTIFGALRLERYHQDKLDETLNVVLGVRMANVFRYKKSL